mmetsp:Transcript_42854/g.103513  ORF Transcript_42854/g.103513 Transcript_42854/m.103513 type:complete len:130 (-) Transcript_42854:68-457(-)
MSSRAVSHVPFVMSVTRSASLSDAGICSARTASMRISRTVAENVQRVESVSTRRTLPMFGCKTTTPFWIEMIQLFAYSVRMNYKYLSYPILTVDDGSIGPTLIAMNYGILLRTDSQLVNKSSTTKIDIK